MLGGTLGGFGARPVRAASSKISVYSALNESTNNAFIGFSRKPPRGLTDLLPVPRRRRVTDTYPHRKSLAQSGHFSLGDQAEFHSPLGQEGLPLVPYKSPNAAGGGAHTKTRMACGRGGISGSSFVLNTDRFAKEMRSGKSPLPGTTCSIRPERQTRSARIR
jgi:hypothetical protein